MQTSTQSPLIKAQSSTSSYSNRYSQRRSPPKSTPKESPQKVENPNNNKIIENKEHKLENDENQEIRLINNNERKNKEYTSSDQANVESEEEVQQIIESKQKEEIPNSRRSAKDEDLIEKIQETNQSFGGPSSNENNHEKEDELLNELKALAKEIPAAQRSRMSPNKTRATNQSYMRNSHNGSQLNQTQNMRSLSPNAISVEEFSEYYEIFCIAFLKRREEELERKRRLKEELELAELQDKPHINSKPPTRKHIPLLDRTPILNARREREIEKIRKEKEEKEKKELEELTFQPKINERSKELVSPTREYLRNGKLYSRAFKGSPNSARKKNKELFHPSINEHSRNIAGTYKEKISDDVVDRLYHQFDLTKNKREELARRLSPNFTPILNKKTKKINKRSEATPHDYIYTEYDEVYNEEYINEYDDYDPGKRCETEPVRVARKETARFGSNEEIEEEYDVAESSEVELLGILKHFNAMLKQKNENPVNLQQLGSLLGGFAQKRKLEKEIEQKKLERQLKQNTHEFSEEENSFEPTQKKEETEIVSIINEMPSAIEKEKRSHPGEIKNPQAKEVSPQKITKSKVEPQNNDEKKYQEKLSLFDVSSGSKQSSPNKSGDLTSQLISHPRSKSKNDDPPVTSMNPELIQKALGDRYNSPQRTENTKKTLYSSAKSKKKGDGDSPNNRAAKGTSPFSPATPSKKTNDKKTSFKETSVTPTKGTTSSKKEKNSSSKKNKSPISKKDQTRSPKKSAKGEKAKSKSDKKTKGSKSSKDSSNEKAHFEKCTQTSKKATGSDISSQIVDSKNALEGWSNRERECGEEDLFMREQSEERVRGHYNRENEASFGSKNNEGLEDLEKKSSCSRKNNSKNNLSKDNGLSEHGKGSKGRNSSQESKGSKGQISQDEGKIKNERNSSNNESLKSVRNETSKIDEGQNNVKSGQKGRNRAQTDNVVREYRQSRFTNGRKRGYSEQKEIKPQNEQNSLNKLPEPSEKSSTVKSSTSNKNTKGKHSISSIKDNHHGQHDTNQRDLIEGSLTEDRQDHNDSIDHDPDSHDDSSTIGQNEENNMVENVNVSFSANTIEKSAYTEHQAPQNDQRILDEINNSKSKSHASKRTEDSRKKSRRPPRPENQVMSTEIIQIYPNSKTNYGYSMDRSDQNISSASSRGLKQIVEHVVKKFRAYDAQIRKGREYTVSVSPPRSGSHSPDTYQVNKQNQSAKKVFRTVQNDNEVNAKEITPRKQRSTVHEKNLNNTLLSNGSAKKAEANKRYSVTSGPLSRYTGGK